MAQILGKGWRRFHRPARKAFPALCHGRRASGRHGKVSIGHTGFRRLTDDDLRVRGAVYRTTGPHDRPGGWPGTRGLVAVNTEEAMVAPNAGKATPAWQAMAAAIMLAATAISCSSMPRGGDQRATTLSKRCEPMSMHGFPGRE